MKNFRFMVLLITVISIVTVSMAQEPRKNITGDFLLETQWGDQNTCKYTPGNTPLGCHSIAIAQVLYYHRLAPSGSVNYKSSNGLAISEDFSDYMADWQKISVKLTESSTQDVIDATAYYNYAVAAIVQKDFSTVNYVDIEKSNNHKTQIEEHFNCRYESYTFINESSLADLFAKNDSFIQLIKKEIDSRRPIGLYYIWDQSGHAIVIDGYTEKEGKFYVHANYGWSGHSDGWYLLAEDLPESTKVVMFLTMEPVL